MDLDNPTGTRRVSRRPAVVALRSSGCFLAAGESGRRPTTTSPPELPGRKRRVRAGEYGSHHYEEPFTVGRHPGGYQSG